MEVPDFIVVRAWLTPPVLLLALAPEADKEALCALTDLTHCMVMVLPMLRLAFSPFRTKTLCGESNELLDYVLTV